MLKKSLSKTQKAQALIDRAKAEGITPSLEGNWVVWKPAPSVDFAMSAMMDVDMDEVARLMKNGDGNPIKP